jgi:alkylation response protein AidB-like acyl-CoA dehydrogenase
VNGARILAAAEALAPELRRRSDEIESNRRMPDDLVAKLRAAGVFRMSMPAAWGGPEVDLWTQVCVVEALARADASAGWYAMIGSDGGFYSAFLEDAVGRELWPDLDAVTAGFITPVGRALVDGDGYVVSGRWAFGSAGVHSRWLASGCIVFEGDAPRVDERGMPELIIALLPTEACEIHDTWHTLGLRGTASNDYSVERIRVPAEHTFHLLFGTPKRRGTIYGAGNLFLGNMAGVPLGIAAHAVEELRALVLTKRSITGMPLHEVPEALATLGRVEVQLAAARALVRETLEDIEATTSTGEALSERQRAMFRGCLVHAADTGREVALVAFRTAGGSAAYARNPFERLVRDALTAGQHVVFGSNVFEDSGRLFLGLPPQAPLI